jgi:hypothetical protein
MSGGHYDYQQHAVSNLAADLEETLNEDLELPEKIRGDILLAIGLLKRSAIYVQRLDWLLSGDDSEETYRQRLEEEIIALKYDELKGYDL